MTWSDTLVEPLAGDLILAADDHELYEAVKAITDPWTTYTPAWTASVNPAIGNGSITGKYIRSGKLVIASVAIGMGSTTTYGTGTWIVSLPVTAAAQAPYVGVALVYDASSSTARRAGCAYLSSTTAVAFVADGDVAAAVPFTWATSDALRFLITYEAA